jgi:hypothetical protein
MRLMPRSDTHPRCFHKRVRTRLKAKELTFALGRKGAAKSAHGAENRHVAPFWILDVPDVLARMKLKKRGMGKPGGGGPRDGMGEVADSEHDPIMTWASMSHS